ncbi:unnamed protein product [Candidula unifasciata]|uniref:Uncharacterized protein n=1 Tax=Candidula unifasciata TaxID=100452 RepID=A0A8S3YMA4_9EUPU|nr:unnamed protein product [Candidula unifasciata]
MAGGEKTYHMPGTYSDNYRTHLGAFRKAAQYLYSHPIPKEPYKYESLPGVLHLFEQELERYICTHDAALVMFYGEPNSKFKKAKQSLIWAAAQNNTEFDQPYGAVDCTKYENLCQQHGAHATSLPQFNLYVGGKIMNTYNHTLSAEDMMMLVDKSNHELDLTPLPLPVSKRQRFLKSMCSCVVGQKD